MSSEDEGNEAAEVTLEDDVNGRFMAEAGRAWADDAVEVPVAELAEAWSVSETKPVGSRGLTFSLFSSEFGNGGTSALYNKKGN